MIASSRRGRVKMEIDAGQIGAPCFSNIGLFRNQYSSGANGWRFDRTRAAFWILEDTFHFFGLVLWYLAWRGDPVSVCSIGTIGDEASGMFENISTMLRRADGAVAAVTHSAVGTTLWPKSPGPGGAIRTHWQGTMDRDNDAQFEFLI